MTMIRAIVFMTFDGQTIDDDDHDNDYDDDGNDGNDYCFMSSKCMFGDN